MNGVRVLRTRSTTFDRTKISQRGVNYVTYLADTIVRSLSIEAPSLLLCMTDPPIVGDLGVALARRFQRAAARDQRRRLSRRSRPSSTG